MATIESAVPDIPTMAHSDATDNPAGRGLRLLSLDGGGVRGVSELYILEQLMTRLKTEQNLDKDADIPKPCEVFDMICGTSTGGLIAIMLGRLRMSIKQCQDAYAKFAESVFGDPKSSLVLKDGRFKATNLKNAIMETVNSQGQGDRMLDRRTNACKVFVCATPESSRRARRLRTYSDNNINDDCAIWEAARASSAAPVFFKAAEISFQHGITERFVDGGIGCNNPALELCSEAQEVYKSQQIDCIISLGTGTSPPRTLNRPSLWQTKIPVHVVPTLVEIATDCERSHEIMYQNFKNKPNTYFRLNVPGLGDIGLAEWTRLGEIRTKTISYLKSSEVEPKVDAAVEALRLSLSGNKSRLSLLVPRP